MSARAVNPVASVMKTTQAQLVTVVRMSLCIPTSRTEGLLQPLPGGRYPCWLLAGNQAALAVASRGRAVERSCNGLPWGVLFAVS